MAKCGRRHTVEWTVICALKWRLDIFSLLSGVRYTIQFINGNTTVPSVEQMLKSYSIYSIHSKENCIVFLSNVDFSCLVFILYTESCK